MSSVRTVFRKLPLPRGAHLINSYSVGIPSRDACNPIMGSDRAVVSAGSDRIAIVALGDTDRFFELWEQELRPRLASIAVSTTG